MPRAYKVGCDVDRPTRSCEICGDRIFADTKLDLGVCQRTEACRKEQRKRYRRSLRERYPLYTTWADIKVRCVTGVHASSADYVGRGISLYAPWIDNYQAFETWIIENLGPRPEGASLDRKDNDGNYEPGNLRWATALEQTHNRRQQYRETRRTIDLLREQIRSLGAEPVA